MEILAKDNVQNVQIGWKVLKRYGKNYCSCISNLRRIYKVGKIISRRKDCGPLAVFDTRKNAEHFVYRNLCGSAYIVECRYSPSLEDYLYYPNNLISKTVNDEHGHVHNGINTSSIYLTPRGTLYADWVHFNQYPEEING